jgi:hypothetical protein
VEVMPVVSSDNELHIVGMIEQRRILQMLYREMILIKNEGI